jgi:hypothetical protein
VESLYYLDGVTFNSNTHRLIDAVRRTSIGHWDVHPDDPRSGAAYYLMVTMVVLFSLVAMTSKSVRQCLALETALLFSHFIGAARLAYR